MGPTPSLMACLYPNLFRRKRHHWSRSDLMTLAVRFNARSAATVR
jgi:hypothetical protein